MKQHLQYLKYVLRHKYYVFIGCRRLGVGLWQSLIHDWSKFLPCEWIPYTRYFYGNYETAEVMNRRLWSYTGPTKESVAHDFDRAWLHHQHYNPHHWQHFMLREDDGKTQVLMMPEKYAREMVADWYGAGRALGKSDIQAWYEQNKDKIVLHSETRSLVEDLLIEVHQWR